LENVGLIKSQKSQVKLIMGKVACDLKINVAVDLYSEKAKVFSA